MYIFTNLSGIFSEILVFSVLFYCGLKTKTFNLKKETFSHFGSIKETAQIFNICLLIYLIFRSVFVFKVIDYFSLWQNYIIVFSYVLALLSIFLAAFFTVKEHEFIHFLVSRLAVITSIIFLISLGIVIINRNFFLGIFNFAMFLLLLIIGFRFLLKKKTNAIYQIYFFTPIIIWDWIMTLKLFNII